MSKQQEQEIKELRDKLRRILPLGAMAYISADKLAQELISSGYVNINNIKLTGIKLDTMDFFKTNALPPECISCGKSIIKAQLAHNLRELGK